MLVSFIIPCYNASDWITRCLDSIYSLGISEEEFEILVVDDASTDDTMEVLERYSNKHRSVQIVRHLVNRNVGAARNTGLSIAQGRYITFVDSDDVVCPGIMTVIRTAETANLDIVASRVQMVSENGELFKEKYLLEPENRVFSGEEFQVQHPFWHTAIHGYIFSAQLLLKVQYYFVEGVYYEDSDYLCRHFLKAERMSYCNECGYRYYKNPRSITQSFSLQLVFGYVFLGVRLLDLYEQMDNRNGAFAWSILKSGSFIIMKGFKALLRLSSISDVCMFYNLFDARVNRTSLLKYKEPAYCWKWRTRFMLKHRHLTTMFVGTLISSGAINAARRLLRKAPAD